MKVRLSSVVLVLVSLIGLAVVAGFLVVYAGVYDVAATRQHTQPVFHLLEYALQRSVKVRADEVAVPDLADAQRIRRGAEHYRMHCLQCHGAPGVAPDKLAFGMTPEPVNLVSTARDWQPNDVYWVVRHGIKMTGMPAWETKMSDEEIWDTVAFVMALPGLSPAEYAAIDPNVAIAAANRRGTKRGTADVPPPAMTAHGPEATSGFAIGDVEAGRRTIGLYLCATCHEIPGVTGAHRQVGPPLQGIANRRYIAGIVVNTPENMMRWLRNPQTLDPLSAMPDLGVTEEDARNITAYLYTLEDIE